jgi:ribosome-dependent ATPase
MGTIVTASGVSHRYNSSWALRDVSLTVAAGTSIALIGPDGVGKSTLLALLAGAKRVQDGAISIFGGDIRKKSVRRILQQRSAYMPQGLGRNLYPDLSIRENLEFFGQLYGHDKAETTRRIHDLLEATGLSEFIDRPVGKLSGGMKQKLGLCSTLIHDPDMIILDEPTTGVDPLSRRQFWSLIDDIRARQQTLTLLAATSYMEEADQFDHVIMMDEGRIIAQGSPAELKRQCAKPDLEKAFISFLPERKRVNHVVPIKPDRDLSTRPVAIQAENLTRRFGDFIAVDHVSFKIATGEIFGFLGSNGCGKTTTMKMLTGLLPVSDGQSTLFGQPLIAGDLGNRKRIGYMSQAFSLYGELTVDQNLRLHAHLFDLPPRQAERRVQWLYDTFDLAAYRNVNSGTLPLGVRQRLSLAVAVIHEPEILILDEPTSGVDPVARDNFWSLLIHLADKDGVTIFISTHFMNEAARCDRVSLMHAGKVIATDTPENLRTAQNAPTLDQAFVAYLEKANAPQTPTTIKTQSARTSASASPPIFSFQRILAYIQREMLEMLRDPIRLSVATLGTTLLMLIFGFGITLDVDFLKYAVLDQDRTPESRSYVETFQGSTYFQAETALPGQAQIHERLRNGDIALALEIPPDFGKDLRRGKPTEIAATIDGSMPFRAETIGGYVLGMHNRFLKDQGLQPVIPLKVETRYRYNQSFESINAMVPSIMGLMLIFIPAILAALSVVREKEMGSIANLYVTPVSRLEFILGKQVPYVLFSMLSFGIMFLMALLIFGIPFKGSLGGLVLGALAYCVATTGVGLLISSFTRSQIAALFGTALLTMMPATQFSGMLQPVATLDGLGYWIGTFYPTTYFLKVCIGAFTQGLDFASLSPFIVSLFLFATVLLALNVLLLKKQEK